MPRSSRSKDPLLVRLKEVVDSLRRIAKTDRMVRRQARRGDKFIQGFYLGAIQAGTMSAKLIEDAVRIHGAARAGAR